MGEERPGCVADSYVEKLWYLRRNAGGMQLAVYVLENESALG